MSLRAISIVQATDADVVIKVGPAHYGGFSFHAAADGSIKVYDCATVATASNANLIDIGSCDIDVDGISKHSNPAEAVRVQTGLVAVISGAGNLATIWYK